MSSFLNKIKNKWNQFRYNPESIKTITYTTCFIWVVILLWFTQKN